MAVEVPNVRGRKKAMLPMHANIPNILGIKVLQESVTVKAIYPHAQCNRFNTGIY